jgi:hypothetical protein
VKRLRNGTARFHCAHCNTDGSDWKAVSSCVLTIIPKASINFVKSVSLPARLPASNRTQTTGPISIKLGIVDLHYILASSFRFGLLLFILGTTFI